MGKASRQQRQEFERQQQLATDLSIMQVRPYLLAGIQVDAVDMMTPMGKTPGCRITFHMQNGDIHNPILIDPILGYQIIAAIATAISNPQGLAAPAPLAPSGVTPPDHDGSVGDETPVTAGPGDENTTPSGLILPS